MLIVATATQELEELWGEVVRTISEDSPKNRAFLTLTKPLGLLKGEGAPIFSLLHQMFLLKMF